MTKMSPSSEPPFPTTDSGKSLAALTLMLVVCWVAVIFPAAPYQLLNGLLLLATGGLIVALPPRIRLPGSLYLLAGAILVLAAGAFLPASWFAQPFWRLELESLGLTTGPFQAPHARQSFEKWIGLGCGLAVVLYVLGHRISDRTHLLLLWGVSLIVASYASFAMWAQVAGWLAPWDVDSSFGFFPNRNHTATLLVMGSIAALGCLLQSVRQKRNILAGLSALNLALIELAIWGFSPSRAGAVLSVLFTGVWLTGLGPRYISRRLLLSVVGIAGVGAALFLVTDGELKKRLHESVPKLAPENFTPNLSAPAVSENSNLPLDFRLRIFRDALTLIQDAPWTGVGLGNFRYIFPQYRKHSASGSQAIHPESDWLLLAGECGWPTVLALAGSVGWLLVLAWRNVRNRPQWILRWSGLLAATVVPVHGLFDVPGHRIGLSWTAVVLLALSFRENATSRPPTRWTIGLYRTAGALVILIGALLLQAEWSSGRPVALTRAAQLEAEAQFLYELDEAERAAAPPGQAPLVIPSAEDKLEKAMSLLDQAIQLTPLAPELHFKKGFLALHFSDMYAIADKEFALERRLDPQWIRTPLRQAHEWGPINPDKAEELWKEAFRRVDALRQLTSAEDLNQSQVREQIVSLARGNDVLMDRALKYLLPDAERLMYWANQASPRMLDEKLPGVLTQNTISPEGRRQLLGIWIGRGNRAQALQWQTNHPEALGEGPGTKK